MHLVLLRYNHSDPCWLYQENKLQSHEFRMPQNSLSTSLSYIVSIEESPSMRDQCHQVHLDVDNLGLDEVLDGLQ